MVGQGRSVSRLRTSERLNRPLIVEAAIGFVDRHGLQRLTMRILGQELGVEAMALYRYVSGREDLLEAMVARLLEGLRESLDDQLSTTWQGYLQTLAHRVRQVATDHPGVFPLIATRHPSAPWLRPPLRSMELVDDFLSTLSGHGFSDGQVANAYRAFSSFLLGNLLLEVSQRGAETSPVGEPLDEGGAQIPERDGQIDLRTVPAVAHFRELLSEDRSEEEFEIGLETLINRLEMELSQ